MKIKKENYPSIIIGSVIVLVGIILFFGTRWFSLFLVGGLLIALSSYIIEFFKENSRQKAIEEKFLEFSRGLVDKVRTGIPIPRAVQQVSNIDYGALSPYIKKLSNQIGWGIPMGTALTTFANDTENKVIKRSVSIVIEAEKSGGNIQEVLQAVTDSVLQIKKIKDERRSNTYSQMVQGYFVFFIFIAIMIILKIYLIPQLGDITTSVLAGVGGGFEAVSTPQVGSSSLLNLDNIFIGLIIIQGFFAGIMVGKFAEGELKMGLKHSMIMILLGYVVISTVLG